jgi:hypothetical protein
MSEAPVFSRPLRAVEVPAEGKTVEIVAGEAERAALAAAFGLVGIDAFSATFDLRRTRAGGIAVSGRFEADIRQTCVVTLDPFDARVTDDIDVVFLPGDAPAAGEADQDTDLLVDGRLDLGAVASEFLALALDPHPRKPGAVFEAVAEPEGDAVSPFAGLGSVAAAKRSDRATEK